VRTLLGLEQRIVFVTGKGGVGKSTVAAALARSEADNDSSAVLVEFEGATAAARALGDQGFGIETVVVDYLDALAGAVARLVSSKILGRVVVKQRALGRVVQAVPAIRELVALERVRQLAEEVAPTRVIVDLPATGHAVDWLRVPAAAERFLRIGPAARMCREIIDQVLAKNTSAICVVSTAEPVVASETRELCHRLHHELGRSPSLLVVNRVPRRPTVEEIDRAEELASGDAAYGELAHALAQDAELAADAQAALAALGVLSGARLSVVPELFRDPSPELVATYLETPA
jgi:hypothetical protein